MGYFEYFVYSKNKNPVLHHLFVALAKKHMLADVLCKTTAKTDIYSDKVTIFGKEIEICPISIKAGTKGFMVGTDCDMLCSTFGAFFFQMEAVCLDGIMLSANQENKGKTYDDYFIDSTLKEVKNGK